MAPPLASLFLIFTASAWAADCPIPTVSYLGEPARRLPAEHPHCVLLRRIEPEYDRLTRTAGLAPAPSLTYAAVPQNNAFFSGASNQVTLLAGYLAIPPRIEDLRQTLAHELGHAVQHHGEEGRELARRMARLRGLQVAGRLQAAHLEEWKTFSRRYEAQADAIAQQLLSAAGFPASTARVGAQQAFGCRLNPYEPLSTHPAGTKRVVNATLGQALLSQNAALLAAEGAFDGSRARAGGTAVSAGRGRGPLTPAVKLSDFDREGRLLPGRLVAGRMRVPMPQGVPGPNPLRGMAYFANTTLGAMRPTLGRAIDGIATRKSVTEKVLQTCRAGGDSEALARDFGVSGWTRRLATDGAVNSTSMLLRVKRTLFGPWR